MKVGRHDFRGRTKHVIHVGGMVALALTFCTAVGTTVWARSGSDDPRHVRILDVGELGVANPSGLAFSSEANAFFVLGKETGATVPSATLLTMSHVGKRLGLTPLAMDPTGPIAMTFDVRANRLLLLDLLDGSLWQIDVSVDGQLASDAPRPLYVPSLSLIHPSGIAVDAVNGDLFILDRVGPRLVRVDLHSGNTFEAAVVSDIPLERIGHEDVLGLACDPTSGHLYVLSPSRKRSGDLTDPPSRVSLYISDEGRMDQSEAVDYGRVAEVSLTPPSRAFARSAMSASMEASTLVQTIHTSSFSPPGPDAAGVTYLDSSSTLLIADSEVNEMPIFEGVNVFQTSLDGVLLDGFDITWFSDEPTGVTVNPNNNHLFFSDDTGTRSIYELNPGPDGILWTADDSVTSFDTRDFGSSDPEGVAWWSGSGALFIADGVNEEVYQVTPGANGRHHEPWVRRPGRHRL
jgi:hypothetical protein